MGKNKLKKLMLKIVLVIIFDINKFEGFNFDKNLLDEK